MNKRFNSRWVKSKKLKLILFIRNSYIQHISQSVSGQFLIAKMQLYKSLCVSVAKLKSFFYSHLQHSQVDLVSTEFIL